MTEGAFMEETLGLAILGFGLIVAAAAAHHVQNASAKGALERNVLIGLRTRATLASDRAWHEGHRAAGPWLTAAVRAGYATGLVTIVACLAAIAVDSALPLAWAVGAAGYTALVALLITGTVKAHTVAKAVSEEAAR
ncbi:SdpI family protein [Nocardiopsis sp. EMB25]|uniref:SdpI family protein n=1 Tax=Nocardiopsis sp. EMB25 TaxID=2835867 RepID=UPI002283D4BF|nr:SdpI family protein [Nocardiopsis sp. EMB25]MCY9784222.1 SdpI family protein [Nocardiopsis sp. EMB25]